MRCKIFLQVLHHPTERPAFAGFLCSPPQMRFTSSSNRPYKNRNPICNLITSYHETLYLFCMSGYRPHRFY
jgi:hypothetical protein